MCIVALAWKLFDDMPVVLLSNRDEFFARQTQPAHQWSDQPIYAGRDQQSGGTWLGYHHGSQLVSQQSTQQDTHQQGTNQQANQKNTSQATAQLANQQAKPAIKQVINQTINQDQVINQPVRWATVLNFRENPANLPAQLISRGALVTDFLTSDLSPMAFAKQLDLTAYAGFNLLVGDDKQAVLINNRGYPPTALHTGLHVISNGSPHAAWFKIERLRRKVTQEVLPLIRTSFVTPAEPDLSCHSDWSYLYSSYPSSLYSSSDAASWQDAAFAVLSDTQQAEKSQLPDTGVGTLMEQLLSAICIADSDMSELMGYGTRTQSIFTVSKLNSDSSLDTLGVDAKEMNDLEIKNLEINDEADLDIADSAKLYAKRVDSANKKVSYHSSIHADGVKCQLWYRDWV